MELDPKNPFVRFLTDATWHTPLSGVLPRMQRPPDADGYIPHDVATYNICTLIKESAWGIFIVSFLVYLIGLVVIFGIPPWLMYFFSDLYTSPLNFGTAPHEFWPGLNLFLGAMLFLISIVAVIMISGALGIVLICSHGQDWIREHLPQRKRSSDPDWKEELYDGFKNKYCVLVKLKKVNDDG